MSEYRFTPLDPQPKCNTRGLDHVHWSLYVDSTVTLHPAAYDEFSCGSITGGNPDEIGTWVLLGRAWDGIHYHASPRITPVADAIAITRHDGLWQWVLPAPQEARDADS